MKPQNFVIIPAAVVPWLLLKIQYISPQIDITMLAAPEKTEYGAYFDGYISKVRGSDVFELLLSQIEELRFVVEQLTEEDAVQPYAPGKWSFKQLLGHINDTEKIMFFRALCIARNEQQAFPGFDQDEYVGAANFDDIPLSDLMEDFDHTRHAIAYFVKHLTAEAARRQGTVSGNPTSARALIYIIPGHFEHHLEILKSIS